MWRLIVNRILIGIFTIFAVSVIIFVGTAVLPGDAAEIRLGQQATEENLAALRRELGLDQPLGTQYFSWLWNFMQGDMGVSMSGNSRISDLVAARYQNTLTVSLWTAAIGVPVSLTLGILAAMFPSSTFDRILTMVSVTLVASPEFFTATLMVLLIVFALDLGSAVVVGNTTGLGPFQLLAHFALPVAALCFVIASQLIRMTRAAVLNVMSTPYIEMAILKGIPRRRIVLLHALPNAIGPIVNIVALNLAYLVTGVIVIEVYFGYSGLASLIIQGLQTRDTTLVQALAMLFCATYVILMLLADIAAMVSNPRLRHPK